MSEKLLFHIAYYMTDKKRVDNKNKVNKQSPEFNNHVLQGVCLFLKEINSYSNFSVKKVVLDVNGENTFVQKINPLHYPTIQLEISYHSFEKEHPFRLTTKHRLAMNEKIDEYDWFGYSEDDTIISKETMEFIRRNLQSFYKKENKVFTIPRMVFNQKGDYFYSDIRTPSVLHRQDYVIPANRFGACWIYPREIMKEWKKYTSFLNFCHPNKDGGIRVKMGTGLLEKDAVIPINKKIKEPCIKCVHLGYSGKYYFKHPKGYHSLPIKKLF